MEVLHWLFCNEGCFFGFFCHNCFIYSEKKTKGAISFELLWPCVFIKSTCCSLQPCVWEWMLYVRVWEHVTSCSKCTKYFSLFFKICVGLFFFLLLSLSFLLVSGIFERLCMRVRACKLRCIFERSWTKLLLGLCPFVCSELILEGFFPFFVLFVCFVCLFGLFVF